MPDATSPDPGAGCPASRAQVIELYFMEHRAKLLDIAAFLDRVDRARPETDVEDFRLRAFREALDILRDDRPHRARRILDSLSDPTTEPIDSAAGMKGALGAPPEAPGKTP